MPAKKSALPIAPPDPGGHKNCNAIREIISMLGDKWSVVTIVQLGERPKRFGELMRSGHGVSQRMLTLTLRQLERNGLIWRKVTPTVPLTVEYGLTSLGCELFRVLNPFFDWVKDHADDIAEAQNQYEARQAEPSAPNS